MQRVKKASPAKLIVTATELVTIENPFFLFGFLDEQNQIYQHIILEDSSLFKCRFNKFEFTEGVEITFPKTGFFTYRIWEQDNDTNLDPTFAGAMVEEGRLVVWDDDNQTPTYNNNEKPITYGDQ